MFGMQPVPIGRPAGDSAIYFDGASYLDFSALESPQWGPETDFSFTAWVQHDNAPGANEVLLGFGDGGNPSGNRFWLYRTTTGAIRVRAEVDGFIYGTNTSNTALSDTDVHFVVFNLRSDEVMEIYVDNVFVDSRSFSVFRSDIPPNGATYKGNLGASNVGDLFFQGRMHNATCYNDDLTASERLDLYNRVYDDLPSVTTSWRFVNDELNLGIGADATKVGNITKDDIVLP